MALLVISKSLPEQRRPRGSVSKILMIHYIILLISDPVDIDVFVMIRVADGEVAVASL